MKSIVAACLLVLLSFSFAYGEMYQWTDDHGVVNFTDNAERIPRKYRERARKVEVGPVTTIPSESPSTPSQYAPPAPVGQGLYGGHDEDWWRGRFLAVRKRIEALQGGLAGKRNNLEQISRKRILYQRPQDRVAYYNLKGEIEQDEKSVADLQNELQVLDQEATTAGVPFDWRK